MIVFLQRADKVRETLGLTLPFFSKLQAEQQPPRQHLEELVQVGDKVTIRLNVAYEVPGWTS